MQSQKATKRLRPRSAPPPAKRPRISTRAFTPPENYRYFEENNNGDKHLEDYIDMLDGESRFNKKFNLLQWNAQLLNDPIFLPFRKPTKNTADVMFNLF